MANTKHTGWRDKALFTPGPLTTSRSVKQAMLRDLGSRDAEFVETVREIRRRLLAVAEVDPAHYTAVLMQGSGTFGLESVLSTAIGPEGGLAVLVNGAYGERLVKMAEVLRIPVTPIVVPEHQAVSLGGVDALDELLATDTRISHVAVVHCETTTGLVNPVDEVAAVARRHERVLVVDAMSSFGAIPVDIKGWSAGYLISSSNKCIQGVPGFSLIIASIPTLLGCEGYARSLSLDLLAQYKGLEKGGQFRFTPPTHALLAFHQALVELEAEGGVAARAARYARNRDVIVNGLEALGFVPYVSEALRGPIITSFHYPGDQRFEFGRFYALLSDREQVIYPGKLSHADCFRIGHIGDLSEGDMSALLAAITDVLQVMGVATPVAAPVNLLATV